MLYIVVGGEKHYISNEVAKRYGLKAGMCAPFTQHKIRDDNKASGSSRNRQEEAGARERAGLEARVG
jgi:hypothetical protein